MTAHRVSLTTGTVLLTAEQIAEHGRACREHVARADAAIARAKAILDGAVSDAEAAEAADSLVGPPCDSHVSRAYISKPSGGEQQEGRAMFDAPGAGTTPAAAPAAGEETPHGPCDCACGCGRRRDPVAVVVERASYGVSLRAAVEDISAEYGLTEQEAEWVETQAGDELEDLAQRGRMVHL